MIFEHPDGLPLLEHSTKRKQRIAKGSPTYSTLIISYSPDACIGNNWEWVKEIIVRLVLTLIPAVVDTGRHKISWRSQQSRRQKLPCTTQMDAQAEKHSRPGKRKLNIEEEKPLMISRHIFPLHELPMSSGLS